MNLNQSSAFWKVSSAQCYHEGMYLDVEVEEGVFPLFWSQFNITFLNILNVIPEHFWKTDKTATD